MTMHIAILQTKRILCILFMKGLKINVRIPNKRNTKIGKRFESLAEKKKTSPIPIINL